jgi:hypothetical protein
MGSPISPMEAIDIIERAIALYKKVKDTPEQINKIGRRMERLNNYLHELQELLDTKKNPGGLASLRPINKVQLESIIKDIKADGQQVYELLKRWEKNIGPLGLQWRFDWFGHMVYGLGSSPDKLDALADNIDKHLNDIDHFILLLISFAQNKQLVQRVPRAPSPSPARYPVPVPGQYNLLFVDGYNVGRSKVAEAYTRILLEWSKHIPNAKMLKVNMVDSAGIVIQNKAAYAQELIDLKTTLARGGNNPTTHALDSLFKNYTFQAPYKTAIEKQAYSSNARGLPANLFSTYDFIISFTKGHELKLIKLRELLVEKLGNSARPRGKGKIVLVADYVSGKEGTDLFEPEDTRDKWNRTTSFLKGCVRAFLKQELGWIEPTVQIKSSQGTS